MAEAIWSRSTKICSPGCSTDWVCSDGQSRNFFVWLQRRFKWSLSTLQDCHKGSPEGPQHVIEGIPVLVRRLIWNVHPNLLWSPKIWWVCISQKIVTFTIYLFLQAVDLMMLLSPGFTELKAACCGGGRLNAESAWLPNSTYCSNRDQYAFWDLSHPSQALHKTMAQLALYGPPLIANPINIHQLVKS